MKKNKCAKALKLNTAELRGYLDIVMFRQMNSKFDNHLLDRLSHRLLDNVDINKMSQDNISELFLDNRKIIGSRIYLQKDHNT